MIPIAEQQRQQIQTQQQAASDIQQRMQNADQWLDKELVEQDISQWQRTCYICTIQSHDWNKYDLYSYQGPVSQAARQWILAIRSPRIQYTSYCAYWGCGIPQSICPQWETRNWRNCKYRDVMIPITAAMLYRL